MILVDTFVAGLPKTKGSMVVRPNGSLANSPASSHWRALMAGAVRDSRDRLHVASAGGGTGEPWRGAVRVSVVFHLPVDPLAYGAGDLDKLLRNLLDALGTTSKNPKFNGGVIVDDNQVTDIDVTKVGPDPDLPSRPGVRVIVATLP